MQCEEIGKKEECTANRGLAQRRDNLYHMFLRLESIKAMKPVVLCTVNRFLYI